jgi:hypothetical protein
MTERRGKRDEIHVGGGSCFAGGGQNQLGTGSAIDGRPGSSAFDGVIASADNATVVAFFGE